MNTQQPINYRDRMALIRIRDAVRNWRSGLDDAQAALTEIEKDCEDAASQWSRNPIETPEPVAYVERTSSGESCTISVYLPSGTPLYAAPQPPAQPASVPSDVWLNEVARLCASTFGQEHSYTPAPDDETWEAHGWVIEAMKVACRHMLTGGVK